MDEVECLKVPLVHQTQESDFGCAMPQYRTIVTDAVAQVSEDKATDRGNRRTSWRSLENIVGRRREVAIHDFYGMRRKASIVLFERFARQIQTIRCTRQHAQRL